MPVDRRQARILAMQALCQWDVQKDDSTTALDDFFEAAEASGTIARYAASVVRAYWSNSADIDQRIERTGSGWSLARMGPVDRNLIRVAVAEMLGGTIPPKVAMTEAIEIGKLFGGPETPGFVNGILDEVYRGILPTSEAAH